VSETRTDLLVSRPDWDYASCGWLALIGLAPAMDEDVFWDLLDRIGWGAKTDPDRAAKGIVKRISASDCAGAVLCAQALGRRLAERLEQWEYVQSESLGLTDDKFMALVHHLIGLGQATYLRVQREPGLVRRFVSRGGFKASVLRLFHRAQALYSIDELTEALLAVGQPGPFAAGGRPTDQQLVWHPSHGLGIALVRRAETRIVFIGGDLLV